MIVLCMVLYCITMEHGSYTMFGSVRTITLLVFYRLLAL